MSDIGIGMIACPKCNAGNPQSANFCGGCGSVVQPDRPRPPEPRPAPPPAPHFSPAPPPAPHFSSAPPPAPHFSSAPPMPPISRFGMAAGGGDDIQSHLMMSQQRAFDHVGQIVVASGGRVLAQSAPSSMQVELPHKDLMQTGGMTVRYRGLLTLTPQAAQQTLVQAKLSVDWNSAGMVVAMPLVAGAFAGMMNPLFFMMWLICGALTSGVSAWLLTSTAQRKVSDKFRLALSSGAPVAAGAGAFGAPAPAPAPAASPSPLEQLERLARLRDAGGISPEEFEAKKADIVKRL